MENKTGESTATTAWGVAIPAITYSYTFSVYETDDELVAAKDELTLTEQRKVRNNERLANARGQALQAALTAAGHVKPTAENNDQVRLRDMFRTLQTAKGPDGKSRKYTDEQARELAATVTGAVWAD